MSVSRFPKDKITGTPYLHHLVNNSIVAKATSFLSLRGTNSGAIWSVHCCPSNGMVAYSGEAGEVAVFKEYMLQDNRMRRAHTAVAGVPECSCCSLQHILGFAAMNY